MLNQDQIDRKYLIIVETNPVEQEKTFIYKSKITDEMILKSHPRINKKTDGLTISINKSFCYTAVTYKWND